MHKLQTEKLQVEERQLRDLYKGEVEELTSVGSVHGSGRLENK